MALMNWNDTQEAYLNYVLERFIEDDYLREVLSKELFLK